MLSGCRNFIRMRINDYRFLGFSPGYSVAVILLFMLVMPVLIPAVAGSTGSAGSVDSAPQYIGKDVCASCHEEQAEQWRGSHHDLAMQEADETTVLGDFNDVLFDWFGVESRFYRKDGDYMVRTDGPDGKPADYRIDYTFGVYPLQQYLVSFPGGRLQALDIAWDSRPGEQGGQRWFHLHPEDAVTHEDVLHWTGMNLNWNYMCADCHSTNLRKNYDAASDSYNTSWSEIDVSCEACHGPGSGHKRWADAVARGEEFKMENMGLTVRLDERKGVSWIIDESSGLPRRSAERVTNNEIQVCARCHSRRSQLTDAIKAGDGFLNGFMPSLLEDGLYHSDGQMQDEVYVWGSFLQSKMHSAGVTCSDCHDPHKAETRTPGDAVCYQCHLPDKYATGEHHFHAADNKGSSCVECHMPPTTFMGVDARHDHSFRVPRPDLSVLLGTPNACNGCHKVNTAAWAADQIEKWYEKKPLGSTRFTPALYAARSGLPGSASLLQQLLADSSQPAIARATAAAAIGGNPDRNTLQMIQVLLNDTDPLIRLGALEALGGMDGRWAALAIPLLWDENRAVRIEAGRVISTVPAERLPAKLTAEQKQKISAGIDEYIEVQQFNAERPEAQVNLATVYANLGRHADAEQAYRKALELQPQFVPAYINMAQYLSDRGRETESENLLHSGIVKVPDSGDLHHALGLSLVRQKDYEGALGHLRKAVELAPGGTRYAYVYGVALQSLGKLDEAIGVLGKVHRQNPADVEILFALTTFNRDAGNRAAALEYGGKLRELLPDNPQIEQLLDGIRKSGK